MKAKQPEVFKTWFTHSNQGLRKKREGKKRESQESLEGKRENFFFFEKKEWISLIFYITHMFSIIRGGGGEKKLKIKIRTF